MTKGLSVTLAVAIIFLVGTLMQEGGPVASLAGDAQAGSLANAEVESEAASTPEVIVARTQVPAPPPQTDNVWDWFNESEPAAPSAPAEPAAAQRQQSAWQNSSSEVGALDRHRMNLEE